MNGLLVIDKPAGMTSRDVVNRVQRLFPRKTKIGHTGTLDPSATGVLVVCIGAATRLADYVQAMGKSYTSRIRLGATSTTDDADGEVTESPNAVPPAHEQLEAALASFVGVIQQVPPAVSALKIEGRRAHSLVRAGEKVEPAARPVRIDAIRLVKYEWPFADVEVDCGKGTYIRSIARDVGAKLGVGGIVWALRRTRVGPFTAEQGLGLDFSLAEERLLPMSSAVANLPKVSLPRGAAKALCQGQTLRWGAEDGEFAVFDERGELIAIGQRVNGELRPKTVLAVTGEQRP
jgi:tRNA pseudouridine55 synthase